MHVVHRTLGALALAGLLALPSPARAQTDPSATAEALFVAGKQMLEAGKYADACPKLAESHRLDPATGTLFALAFCYEKAGQTASAWASYRDVAGRARRESNPEREQAARDRVAALEKELSSLTITVPAEMASIEGLVVKRDGVSLLQGAWNTPMPTDPGPHTVEATAPSRQRWSTTVRLLPGGRSETVRVPALAPVAAPVVAPVAVAPAPVSVPSERPSSTLRTAGYITGAVGLVGLGLGAGFGLRALGKNDDSKADCRGNVCGP
ncbi:MAG: hypothetical protein EOO75_04245, partial [Myxococcales bacterium]